MPSTQLHQQQYQVSHQGDIIQYLFIVIQDVRSYLRSICPCYKIFQVSAQGYNTKLSYYNYTETSYTTWKLEMLDQIQHVDLPEHLCARYHEGWKQTRLVMH